MKTTKLFKNKAGLALALAAIFTAVGANAPLALAQQSITIDSDVSHPVYGNGELANGKANNPPASLWDPNNNEVIVNAKVAGSVFGGDSETSATGNTVTVNSSGEVTASVYGGDAVSYSGSATTAAGNSVSISGGTVGSDVYGGYVYSISGSATANGNSVSINGGTVGQDVFGGYAWSDSTGSVTATGNTVTISGNTTFDALSNLFGGGGGSGGAEDFFTGNTLNLYSAITVNHLENFEFLNFYLPANLGAGDAMITASQSADITNAKISVNILGGSSPLGVNDEITLIDANTISGTPISTAQGMRGVTVKYDFDISAAAGELIAKVSKAEVNERAKALSEGFLAGLALVNQGADLVAGLGIDRAVLAAENGFGAFGAVSYGQASYETGGSVDMSGFSLLTGFSRGTSLTPGRLTLGAFFEYGNGDYDTDNAFANAASVRGDGKADRFGGGLLGRMDFNESDSGHAWLESSLRAGRVENEYHADNLRDFLGRQTGFDSSSTYYGLHFGAGYVWDISEETSLDLYAKYFWSRTAGDDVTLDTGDSVDFDDADSHRLRLGGRLALNQTGIVRPYIGLAWEHEFDGEAQSAAAGHSINAPTMRGDTGIGEIGLSIKPALDTPLSFDLGLSGYVGQRQGAMGTLSIRYDF